MIIFDCDGVLVDSEIISNRINAQALTNLGYPISAEEVARRFIGVDSHTVRTTIISEINNLKLPKEMGDLAKVEIIEACRKELKPLMFNFVQSIVKQNISRCVVSNNTRERVLSSLEFTNQLQFFKDEYIFTAAQVAKGKPDPELFLLAAKQLGYHPKDCIVIEDSASGIKGALAANMKVIGFLGGAHAQYPWYLDKIKAFDIPLARNVEELSALVIKLYAKI